jgi:hypothetical protein
MHFINRYIDKFLDKFPDKFSLLAEALPRTIRIVPKPPFQKLPSFKTLPSPQKIHRAEVTSRNSVSYRIP